MPIRICLFLWAICLSVPAMAYWQRAESEHYVVHADIGSTDLSNLVQRLEDHNRMLRQILPLEIEPGRKLELYLTPNYNRISRIYGFSVSGLSTYSPDAAISFARLDLTDELDVRYTAPFFYAAGFHFEQAFQQPVPPWLWSGFSSFLATAYPLDNGQFALGARDPRRPSGAPVDLATLERVLTYKKSPETQARFNRFYDVSREVAAVVLFDPRYAGAIERHVAAYVSGATMEETASALGDLQTLQETVAKAQRLTRPNIRVITLEPAPPAEFTHRPMSSEEIALIDARFKRHYPRHRAANSRDLRKLTERFASSALVWFEYAANEFARVQNSEFGRDPLFRGFGFANGELIVPANRYPDAEAWRAVNRALAIDPDMTEARRLRAEILLNRLVREGDTADAAGYDEVRQMLAPLARDPRSQPLAAALYHQSYIEQGLVPTEEAFEQLREAFRANASVADLRYAYATALSRRGEKGAARGLLISMLNDPAFQAAAVRALEVTQ